MSLQEYSFLFDALSAIGVVISILYLGYQIHQNTRAMRRSVARDIVRDLNDLGRFFIEKPDLIQLYFAASDQPEELNDEQRFRFQMLLMNVFSHFDLALDYNKDGLIDDASIEIYSRNIHHLFERRAVKDWWQEQGRDLYSSDLNNLMEKIGQR